MLHIDDARTAFMSLINRLQRVSRCRRSLQNNSVVPAQIDEQPCDSIQTEIEFNKGLMRNAFIKKWLYIITIFGNFIY